MSLSPAGVVLALSAVLLCSACVHPPAGTDCHMHVTPAPESAFIPRDGARALVALEGARLKRGCILSPGYAASSRSDQRAWTQEANDWTLAQARQSEDLIPFCGIPIKEPWAVDEARRCAKNGARGLKLHPAAEGVTLTDAGTYRGMGAVAQAAGELKLPILIHIAFTDEEAAAFFRLAASQPKTIFILAHQLGPKLALLPKAPANVYIDISGLVLAPRSAGPGFVALWRKIGMDRIILGSDWPNLHPSEYMAALQALPLTGRERRLIAAENARRLFTTIP